MPEKERSGTAAMPYSIRPHLYTNHISGSAKDAVELAARREKYQEHKKDKRHKPRLQEIQCMPVAFAYNSTTYAARLNSLVHGTFGRRQNDNFASRV
jgi:hypothetical protein